MRELAQFVDALSHFYQNEKPLGTKNLARQIGSIITRSALIPRVNQMGEKLFTALTQIYGQHPNVGDIRGRGLFQAIELVADRSSKQPFDPALGLHKKIKKAAFGAGLICCPMGGTVNGAKGDHVLLAPLYIISNAQIEELVSKLQIAVETSLD